MTSLIYDMAIGDNTADVNSSSSFAPNMIFRDDHARISRFSNRLRFDMFILYTWTGWKKKILYTCLLVHLTNSIYSFQSILLFVNIDVSRHILVIDISVLAKSNMGRREYILIILFYLVLFLWINSMKNTHICNRLEFNHGSLLNLYYNTSTGA
jgi:hypothetical protein